MYNLSVYGEHPGGGWSVTKSSNLAGDSPLLLELIANALKNGYEIEVVKMDKVES